MTFTSSWTECKVSAFFLKHISTSENRNDPVIQSSEGNTAMHTKLADYRVDLLIQICFESVIYRERYLLLEDSQTQLSSVLFFFFFLFSSPWKEVLDS